MPGCWVLLLLVVLGAAGGLALPPAFSYPQALAQAVDAFNQRPEVQNAFRLLSADPEPAPAIQDCVGSVQVLQGSSEMDLRCVDASSDPTLVQRGRIGRFFSKLRRVRVGIDIKVHVKTGVRIG
ncbi:cathelicidin-2-like [Apteryx rowi]|uniref:cathelicidin-2-like n=1 Tax=Apteryx rowi TaxID=308060 RepID=UPI000E1E0FBA|nr:cathelicidin-2-like [Apteryx rowi]